MDVNTIVVVGTGALDRLWEYADEILVSPRVEPANGTDRARRQAIKEAMTAAVSNAGPGDVVMQDDVHFTSDPFQSPLAEGKITILAPSVKPGHDCPQAFRFPDTDTADSIVDAWTTIGRPACSAWRDLPKIHHECATHGAPVISMHTTPNEET